MENTGTDFTGLETAMAKIGILSQPEDGTTVFENEDDLSSIEISVINEEISEIQENLEKFRKKGGILSEN